MRGAARLTAIFLVLALSACAGQTETSPSPTPTPAPTPTPVPVEFSLPYYETDAIHPITGQSRTNLTLTSLVYEGLFALDNTFTATAVLAREWTVSEDGLTWSFALESALFSDGSALAAADVVASLELARTSALYASRLADVREIREEEGRVVLTLSRPRGDLPALLDIPIVRERGEGLTPLGTGRYAFREQGGGLSLERTERGSETLPQTISLTAVKGADELIYAFDTKEISLVAADLTGTDALGYSGGYEVWDYPTTNMVYLGFRTDTGACADETLRRAIALSMDRESVVTALYARHGKAASLPMSPASPHYDPALAAALDYAPAEASQLLEQGGYTWTEGLLHRGRRPVEVTMIVNTDNTFRQAVAEFLAHGLEELGLTVKLEKLSWADYNARLAAGTFDLYLGETALTADFDLRALLATGGALNYGKWSSRETETLMDAALGTGEEGRPAALSALHGHLAQTVPMAPICFKNQSVLTQWGQMTGLTPTRADPFAGDGWHIRSR